MTDFNLMLKIMILCWPGILLIAWELGKIRKRLKFAEHTNPYYKETVKCKVAKGQFKLKKKIFYNHNLLYHPDKKIIVEYHPANITKVNVYDLKNEFICVAQQKKKF